MGGHLAIRLNTKLDQTKTIWKQKIVESIVDLSQFSPAESAANQRQIDVRTGPMGAFCS